MPAARGADSQFIVPRWARPLIVGAGLGFAGFAVHRHLFGLDAHVWLFSLVFPDYGGQQVPNLATRPITELLHRVGGALLLTVGLAQFSTRLRRARPRAHRWAGRVYVSLALLAGVTGIVFGLVMPYGGIGETLGALTFGAALIVATLMGLRRARARAFERHREWMVRSFALCLGPLSVRLVAPIFVYGLSMTERVAIVPSFWLGWLLNIMVAEAWIVTRRRRNTLARRRTDPQP